VRGSEDGHPEEMIRRKRKKAREKETHGMKIFLLNEIRRGDKKQTVESNPLEGTVETRWRRRTKKVWDLPGNRKGPIMGG